MPTRVIRHRPIRKGFTLLELMVAIAILAIIATVGVPAFNNLARDSGVKSEANLLLNSPQAMQASKDLLREVGPGALSPALRRYTENAIARIRVSAEGQEGLSAFLNKRTPAWQESH